MIGFSKIYAAFSSLISFSMEEGSAFNSMLTIKNYRKKEFLLEQGSVCNEIFFINSGIVRNLITNPKGEEITIHFTMEDNFITEYASLLKKRPASCSIQALEDVEAVIISRDALQYGYEHTKEGNKLGRLIAEHYFMMISDKVEEIYANDVLDRFDKLNDTFPGIHQRVPQHMIASFLGITPVHLSRLKSSQVLK
ncbi:MAG: Crp/Fnr family transcriptional regulator [Bacteroidia bacterium]